MSATIEYEATLREWALLPNSPRRNAVFLRNHAAFKAIRNDPAGRELIERLAADPDDAVALGAAAHCLWFNPSLGERVLDRLAALNSEIGLTAVTTVRQFRKGALNLDW